MNLYFALADGASAVVENLIMGFLHVRHQMQGGTALLWIVDLPNGKPIVLCGIVKGHIYLLQTCLSPSQTDNVAHSPSLTILSDPPNLRRTVKLIAVDYNLLTVDGHSQSGDILNVDGELSKSGVVVGNSDVAPIFIFLSVNHAESLTAGEDLVPYVLPPV